MESKRQSQQDGDERDDQKWRRERQDSQISENFRIIPYLRYLASCQDDLRPYLKDLVGKLVREELERQLVPRPISTQTEISGARRLKLVFRNELPDTIYTFSKSKASDNTPLQVFLFDIESQSIVSDEDDPLSSIKIEICVLNGEFGSDSRGNWSRDEFNSKILPPRENKGPLLKGNLFIKLKNGVGSIEDILFTDNSCWVRTRKFRLAVMVKSNLNIKEGISKPFTVKDSRVKKKKDLSLNDEIWNLKHISKKGKIYEHLSEDGIYTIEDLLKEHETNPSSLQEKFGKTSKRKREEIIMQAKKAKHARSDAAEAIFDNYQSENNTLNSDQRHAYKKKDLMQIEPIKHSLQKTLTQDEYLQEHYFRITQQGENLLPMEPLNWLAEEFIDENPLFIRCDDEAGPSNYSSLPK